MTSLQQQLSSIRAQSSQELNLRAQKTAHSKSLIFPPAEASSQSLFDIYQFCVRAFKGLCKLDARFATFAGNLFGEQSIDTERTHMSRDAVHKLDKILESFLSLVAPRLQLRDAQCAVEWLVRRFRVHEHNTQIFILTFLPYHDTNLFAVMLQLVPESKLPSVFAFMRPYMNTRTNFKRPILVREASRRPALLNVLHQYILRISRDGHQAENIISFWVDLSIQVLNSLLDRARSGRQSVQMDRQDEVLLEVGSVLRGGLQIQDAPELTLGCYALLAFVASKAVLDDSWLDSLMVAVVNTRNATDAETSLACLALLAEQRSEKHNKLPRRLVEVLTPNPKLLMEQLGAINAKTSVNRLAFGLALGLLEQRSGNHDVEELQFIADTLERGLLTRSKTKALMGRTIRTLASYADGQADGRGQVLIDIMRAWAKSPEYRQTFQKALLVSGVPTNVLPREVSVELGEASEQVGGNAPGAIAPGPDQHLESATIHLDHLSVTETTFLSSKSNDCYDALRAILADASSHDPATFDDAAEKLRQKLSPEAHITFLIRAWCSSASTIALRQTAIDSARRMLQDSTSREGHGQTLLPFFICALRDPERRIRQIAADCLLIVFSSCGNAQEARSPPKAAQALGMEVMEPSSSDIKAFLKALSPHLEACIIDEFRVTTVVNRLLAGHSSQLHTMGGKESKELKSSVRAALSDFLASCAAQSRLLSVQLRVFPMLSHSNKVGSTVQTKHVYPVVRDWIEQDAGTARGHAALEHLSLDQVNERLFELFHAKDGDAANILLQLVEGTLGQHRGDLEEPMLGTIHRLYRKHEAPMALFNGLIKATLGSSTDPSSSSHRNAARAAFLSIHASAATLSSLLSILDGNEHLQDRPSPAKRRRTSKTNGRRPSLDRSAIQRELEKQTLILEKVEGSKSTSPELLGGLFHALAELMHTENGTEMKLDYLVQLVIRSLTTIIDHMIVEAPQEGGKYHNSIRMDTLVECLRNSSARGIQNDILSLVSQIATWDPELVLHSVMPIFTFMGKSTVRQGDEYTAHVIARTIESVIPPLARSLRRKNKGIAAALSEVLQSFAAAYEHIPSHRRLPLFGLLTKTLGPEDSMFAIVAMLVDRRPTDSSVMVLLSDLFTMFGTETELGTFQRCFDLLLDVHAPNAFAPRRTFSEAILNIKEKTPDQLHATISQFLGVLTQLLKRPDFRARVARVFKSTQGIASAEAVSQDAAYSQLLSRSVNLMQVLRNKHPPFQTDARQALTAVMKILPVAEMLPSIQDILSAPSDQVKIVALRALEEQIQTVNQGDSVAADALLAFVSQLSDVLKGTQEIELKHIAISCIDQITEKFGRRNATITATAAETLAGEAGLGHLNVSLQILALLTLASLVDVLREDFVPFIPRVLQQSYPILEMSAGQERYDELRSALFAVINAVTECLPQMLSDGDLDKALKLCHKSAAGVPVKDDTPQRNDFYNLAVHHLPAEASFSAVQRNLAHAIETGLSSTSEHLRCVLSLVQHHSKRVVREQAATAFRIVAEAWSVRRLSATTTVFAALYDSEAVGALQQLANDVALAVINKLNDDTLRPHFANLVQWVTAGEATEDQTGRICNTTSFFSFVKLLNDRFKALMTNYVSYYLDLASDTLEQIQPTTSLNVGVLQAVLDALASNFSADESDYWQDPQHFEAIVTQLLQQVARFAQSERALLEEHVFPPIRELVTAAYSADKRVQVNTEVLKLLRHDDPAVRLAAVQCQRDLLKQVGEDWVTMVSQMLPFISEAQEDGDEDVELETRKWIRELEAGLGESMAGMLQ